MSWLDRIKALDGIEEKGTYRIVSHINGDSYIQLSGFFTVCEVISLSDYLKQLEPQCRCEQCQPSLQTD